MNALAKTSAAAETAAAMLPQPGEEKRTIRLFACDLDGTLLNEQHTFDTVIEAGIRRVIGSGRFFTLATGRNPSMIPFHALPSQLYAICMNGSLILGPSRHILKYELLDKAIVKELLARFGDLDLEFITPQKVYMRQSRASFLTSLLAGGPPRPKKFKPSVSMMREIAAGVCFHQSAEQILKQDVCKINCHVRPRQSYAALQAFIEAHGEQLVNAPCDEGLFEITKAGVHKGSALAWLAKHLQVVENEVAAYGDGGNDLEMLRMFPHSYAPCTASKAARQSAAQIIGPYEEYSVIRHIEETLREMEPTVK